MFLNQHYRSEVFLFSEFTGKDRYILSCPHPHPYTFKRRVFAIMNQRTSQLMLALRKLRKGAVLLEVTPSHICKILLVVYTSVLSLACGVPGRSAWSEWECSWEGHGFWILSTRSCFMEKKKKVGLSYALLRGKRPG